MTIKHVILIPLLCLLVLASCENEDDTWSDSYQLDFLELLTDTQGRATLAVTDRGDSLEVENPVTSLKSDTLYRCVAFYVQPANGKLNLRSVYSAISPFPSAMADREEHTDAVKIQSMWRGGRYVNMTLLIGGKEKTHYFAFKDNGTVENADGSNTAHVLLYHDANGDMEAFSHTAYLSLPLYFYDIVLQTGRDTVAFCLHVKEKGMQTYYFPL